MPEDVLRRSTVTAIEIDPLTARIAKALYPDADIRAQPFEQTKLADGFYDLAVSNVPFGDYTVHDPRWNSLKLPIHDYFFASALETYTVARPWMDLRYWNAVSAADLRPPTAHDERRGPEH